jgi:hypothetical protein
MLWEARNILNILTCNALNKHTTSENGHAAHLVLITKSAIIRSPETFSSTRRGFIVLVVSAEYCEALFIVGSVTTA